MKNIIFIFSIFSLLACSQNTDKPDVPDPFIDNALSILEELGNYYPPEDIDLLFSQTDSNGFQTATFNLKGKTRETVERGSFAKREYVIQSRGTTCITKWQCAKEIAKCLDNGDAAKISNGACKENSAWCVECIPD